jgi:hypothetical protein
MTFGYLIPKNINGDRWNLKRRRENLREFSFFLRNFSMFKPNDRPRSGFSFLSTTEGVLLHGKEYRPKGFSVKFL